MLPFKLMKIFSVKNNLKNALKIASCTKYSFQHLASSTPDLDLAQPSNIVF